MAGKTIPLRKSNGQFNGSKSRSGGGWRGSARRAGNKASKARKKASRSNANLGVHSPIMTRTGHGITRAFKSPKNRAIAKLTASSLVYGTASAALAYGVTRSSSKLGDMAVNASLNRSADRIVKRGPSFQSSNRKMSPLSSSKLGRSGAYRTTFAMPGS